MRASLAVAAVVIAGCGTTEQGTLVVDVRTDAFPVSEFDQVRVRVDEPRGVEPATVDVADDSDWLQPRRVATLSIRGGTAVVRVELLKSGVAFLHRTVSVAVRGLTGVTVSVTAACRGFACPAPGGDPTATTCLGGACVRPDCIREPGLCDSLCEEDADCDPTAECFVPHCRDGLCTFTADSSRCPPGDDGLPTYCFSQGCSLGATAAPQSIYLIGLPSEEPVLADVAVHPDGTVSLVGSVTADGARRAGWLVTLAASFGPGNVEELASDSLEGIALLAGGDPVVVGTSTRDGVTTRDLFASVPGVWAVQLELDDGDERARAALVTAGDAIWVVGDDDAGRLIVARLSSADGSLLSMRRHALSAPALVRDAVALGEGALIVGEHPDEGSGFLVRLDDAGDEIWRRTDRGGSWAAAAALDADVVVGGRGRDGAYRLARLDPEGAPRWAVDFGEPGSHGLVAVGPHDGGLVVVGADAGGGSSLFSFDASGEPRDWARRVSVAAAPRRVAIAGSDLVLVTGPRPGRDGLAGQPLLLRVRPGTDVRRCVEWDPLLLPEPRPVDIGSEPGAPPAEGGEPVAAFARALRAEPAPSGLIGLPLCAGGAAFDG